MDGKSADRTESIDEKAVAIAENGTAEHCDGPSLDGQALAPGHREYLLQRHGTVDLIPLPCQDPADPLNWPNWKVSDANLNHKRMFFNKSAYLETLYARSGGLPRTGVDRWICCSSASV